MTNDIYYVKGERIALRPFEREDVSDDYRQWMNDPEVINYILSGVYPQNHDNLLDYYESHLKSRNNILFAIVEIETQRHIGNARLHGIDLLHRKAVRGIVIGDRTSWGKGYGSEAINLVSLYGFETLNLHKLISYTLGDNAGIIKVNEKCGYIREGLMKQEFFRNGKYHDAIYWALFRDHYETLKNEGKLIGIKSSRG